MRLCSVEGCEGKHEGKGYCRKHYTRWYRNGTIEIPVREEPPCAVYGCDRTDIKGHGYCCLHYARWYRTGSAGEASPRLNTGALVLDKNGYRVFCYGGKRYRVHRVIMEYIIGRPLLPHENVHHVNGDRADNRPENLELWSSSQPPGQRVSDKVAWAKEILALYEPDYIPRRAEL